MELHEKNEKELREIAKKLKLTVPKNIDVEDLRLMVERAAIERHEKVTEQVRENLREKAKIKQRIAEIKVSADLAKIAIKIPVNPTIIDVVRLEKELGIKKKIPKPSPETRAIENSRKVYALFRNLQQDDEDVIENTGGKFRIHFWPDKVHVVPEWLINHYRSPKNPSGTYVETKYKEVFGHEKIAARMTAMKRRQRFSFEILGEAPKDAKFGVVTDEAILSELEVQV